jgi:putative hemolysin
VQPTLEAGKAMWGFELLVMLAMVLANAVFAAYEIALASVGAVRLARLAEEGRRGASIALSMKRNVERSLAVVQLGITLVGATAAAVGGAGAEEMLAPSIQARLGVSEGSAEVVSILLVVLPLTIATIMFGELIPKVFALRNAEWVTLTLSPAMRWFAFSVWPAVRLFEATVTGVMAWAERRGLLAPGAKSETAQLHDLHASAAVARASRLIGRKEERIIVAAAELRRRPVREIMLAAEHISTLPASARLSEALITVHLDMHTRFPVVERPGEVQTALGYVNVKDIIAALHLSPEEPTLRAIVRSLPSFDEGTPIADCLEQLMHQHTHIAVVRDPAGRVVGMITLEDIIEELVGEIEDEYDRLPAHVVASGRAWVVGGGIPLGRLKVATGIDLDGAAASTETQTLAAWVATQLERDARGGDVITTPAARVLVRKIRRARVQEAQVSSRAGGAATQRDFVDAAAD